MEVAIHFSRSGDRLFAQPTEHLTDGETEGFSKSGDGTIAPGCSNSVMVRSARVATNLDYSLLSLCESNADPEARPPFSQARLFKSDMGFLSPRAWEPVIENDLGLLYSDFYMELR
ncbi:hypothetical protein K4039_02540 [Lyngbya sp. CCAP 1446/10]|uniref:hypothetical protein n=1 Tax=Lyngbya sp. CCAP 1446/10 TaxID=439293 RepID=UPI002237E8B3|nr:hypothetical protein [Lyngbya sp. CCAP 1446/10]MCW6048982.1 hypothetical protein [Lyngbya sp. CCAP 1446/10]